MNAAPPLDADLASMTKAELLQFAKEHGIEGVSSSMTKADIFSIIEGAL